MSKSAASAEASGGRGLVSFFILTFAITWGLQLPGVFAKWGLLPGSADAYMPLIVLGVLGPSLAAWLVLRQAGGAGSRRALFRQAWPRGTQLAWLLLALVLPGALLSGPLFVRHLLGGQGPLLYPPQHAGALIAAIVISLGEEYGWRGFALPRLCERFGRVWGSILLGLVWTVWHVPMFLGVDVPAGAYPLMPLTFLGGSLVFTWLYYRSGACIYVAIAAHVGTHLNNSHQPVAETTTPLLLHGLAWVAFALLLLAFDRKFWTDVPPSATRLSSGED